MPVEIRTGTSLIHIHGLKLQNKAVLGNKVDEEQLVSYYITATRENNAEDLIEI